jgi:hypothetical protein
MPNKLLQFGEIFFQQEKETTITLVDHMRPITLRDCERIPRPAALYVQNRLSLTGFQAVEKVFTVKR